MPVDLVDLGRLGVDLHPDPRRRLVDEVDRLVGEEAVGDVALAERRRGDQRRVLDADLVVDLVALLEPAQDRDRVLDARLADVHRLEAPLERGVLLDVLAVLVERGRADRAQLAAGQHRLEQVGGVDRALGRAGADDRVQLVDEQDDRALGVGDLLEHRLEPVLELAAVLGAGDQRADVERDRRGGRAAPRARRRRRSAGRGPRRSPSCRRRARRSAPGCSWSGGRGPGSRGGSRRRGRSPGRACPAAAASVRSRPYFSSAWNFSSGFWSVTRCEPRTSASALSSSSWPAPLARSASPAAPGWAARASSRCSVETYSSLQLAHLGLGGAQDLDELARAAGGLRRGRRTCAGQLRQRLERAAERLAHGGRLDAELAQHGRDDAALLLEQDGEQVLGRRLRVAALVGQPLGGLERLLGLDREAVWLHRRFRISVSGEILVCMT